MLKKYLNNALAALFLVAPSALFSQNVAINTTGASADPSALLDVKSTTAGVLIPRMTTTQRNAISSPAVGLQIFNTDCDVLNYWTGTCWVSAGTIPAPDSISSNVSTGLCAGATATYSIPAVTGATAYYWSVPPAARITSGQGTTSITVAYGSYSGNVCVTANDACETSQPTCRAVNISSTLSASAGANRSVFCSGLIGGSPTASGGNPPYAYSWNPSASLSSATVANPVASPTVTTTYTVIVTDANGCSATNSMMLAIGGGTPAVFTYTGAIQAWTVPAGVTCVQIQAYGAGGGTGYGSAGIGGLGGYVYGTLTVTPGNGLYIYVGGAGGNASSAAAGPGGWNGGGNGGYYGSSNVGGGGGGATDVRYGGTALSNRVIVGGGGGGGASNAINSTGGAGGYSTGGTGLASGSYSTGSCGAAGTQSAGGVGATSGPGGAGGSGTGGNAYSSSCGGGGGAGYYGGGGGGSCGAGGGGGGSSYYGTLSSPGNTNGVQSGNGVIIITY